MTYKVLAVGYSRNEYEIICPKLLKKNVATDLSETTQKAQCLLREKSYDWAIFHSRVLDSLPYVNVMRSIRHIPIIIIDPEDFGIEQISDVLECFTDFSSKRRNSTNTWSHSFEHGNLHFDQDRFEPNSGSLEKPVDIKVCGFCISEDKREEILTGIYC